MVLLKERARDFEYALHFDGAQGIRDNLKAAGAPPTTLVMHSSSSVPSAAVSRTKAVGGRLDPSARGVDENECRHAARLGVVKVNIDTDGRLVWTRGHREFFSRQLR